MVFLACCVYTALVDVYSLNRNGPQGCVVPITSFYGVLSLHVCVYWKSFGIMNVHVVKQHWICCDL